MKIVLDNQNLDFEHVIFAIHPANILKILKDPSEDEIKILKKFEIEDNTCFIILI